MTEAIWIAIVGGIQAIMLALLGKTAYDGHYSRRQVDNSHVTESGEPYNLRDNIDENHVEVLQAIGRIEADVTGIKKDIGRLDDRDLANGKHHERVNTKLDGMTDRLDRHLEWASRQEDRIDKLEDTTKETP